MIYDHEDIIHYHKSKRKKLDKKITDDGKTVKQLMLEAQEKLGKPELEMPIKDFFPCVFEEYCYGVNRRFEESLKLLFAELEKHFGPRSSLYDPKPTWYFTSRSYGRRKGKYICFYDKTKAMSILTYLRLKYEA